jgi:hypothetical protein
MHMCARTLRRRLTFSVAARNQRSLIRLRTSMPADRRVPDQFPSNVGQEDKLKEVHLRMGHSLADPTGDNLQMWAVAV